MASTELGDRLLSSLAGEYGTPLYVYDGKMIAERYDAFYSAFSGRFANVRICYALKANTSLAVCSLLRDLGAGADVVSAGELKTALAAGFSPEDIIYTSNSKSDSDLALAVDAGVIINVDSAGELESLGKIAAGRKKTARISFRVNPGVNPKTHPKIATGLAESKFGLHIEGGLALAAYRKAARMKHIAVIGVQAHIGSQIQDAGNFVDSARRLFDFALELKKIGIALDFIDFGGGLGISYQGAKSLQPEELAKALEPVIRDGFKRLGYRPALVFEPGRYIVAESGILLTRVNSVKKTPYKNFINVDSGFNTLMRPAMYDAYHRVRIVGRKGSSETYDIAGNVCETGDILARDRMLPKARKGDIIAILDTGAYGMSMTSSYNSQTLPAEVLVRGKRADLIRQRGEQDDLYWRQKIPEDLS
ncbi:MAG: diaminopimelate decarboxylase [Candidatus Altiarchaeota archaeon]|nr:diaminopimelate decarboxylase [Candidatus Altiarchaeota archaeon]